jgi:Tfp pilus assembly protein PilO
VNSFLDQLNLTPQERRIVVAIGMVVIVVLNLLFVWPHFHEWRSISNQLQTMRKNIEIYNKQIALDTNPTNGLQKQLAQLVRQEGTGVMDKQVQLQSTIMTQARKTGVNVVNYNPGSAQPKTNEFFEEESIKINVDSQEPQLISFLYDIGGDPAMIRVSELELSPQDQNRYRLRGAITLTANYAKRATTPEQTAAKPKGAPGTRPGSAPAPINPKPALVKPGPGGRPGLPPGQLPGRPPGKAWPPGQRGPQMPGTFPRTPYAPPNKSAG